MGPSTPSTFPLQGRSCGADSSAIITLWLELTRGSGGKLGGGALRGPYHTPTHVLEVGAMAGELGALGSRPRGP
jgi:hypothetical protein